MATALIRSIACKLLFLASNIGPKSLSSHIRTVCTDSSTLPELERVVLLSPGPLNFKPVKEVINYTVFVSNGHSVFMNTATLRRAERKVRNRDVLNLQFTSGRIGLSLS